MKKLNFIGMAIFAAMLSFSTTSCCSGDDDLLSGGTSGTTSGNQADNGSGSESGSQSGSQSGNQSGSESGSQSGSESGNQSGSESDDPSTPIISLAGTTWTVIRATGQDEDWGHDFDNYSATFNSDGTTVITPSSGWGNPQWSQNGNELKLTYPDKVLIMNLTSTGATTATADCYWEGNKDNAASHATFTLSKH